MANKKVVITEGVSIDGKYVEPGTKLDIPERLANVLFAGNKAEFVKDPVLPKWPVKETTDGTGGAETPENPVEPSGNDEKDPPPGSSTSPSAELGGASESEGQGEGDTPVEPSESEPDTEPEPAEENPSPTLPASGEGGKKGGKK